METFDYADIFFFITTLAVVLLTIFLIRLAVYAIAILRRIEKLSDKIEQGIDIASVEAKDLIGKIKGRSIFQFLLTKSKARRRRSK